MSKGATVLHCYIRPDTLLPYNRCVCCWVGSRHNREELTLTWYNYKQFYPHQQTQPKETDPSWILGQKECTRRWGRNWKQFQPSCLIKYAGSWNKPDNDANHLIKKSYNITQVLFCSSTENQSGGYSTVLHAWPVFDSIGSVNRYQINERVPWNQYVPWKSNHSDSKLSFNRWW